MIPDNNYLIITAIFLFSLALTCSIILYMKLKKNYYSVTNIILIAFIMLNITLGLSYVLNLTGIIAVVDSNSLIWDVCISGEKYIPDNHLMILYALIKNNVLVMAFLLFGLSIIVSASNLALIRHEGFSVRNVVGAGLEIMFVTATAMVYYLDTCVISPLAVNADAFTINRCIKVLILMYLYIYYLDMILLGIFIMGYIAARQKPKYDKDFIIIPGCSIRKDGSLLPLLKGRTNRAIKYAWEQEINNGRKVLYVPSGGQGPDEIMSEGSAMELYLLSHSAESDEVYPEKKSRNTYENFLYSKKIIDEINPNANIAFSTTNYHVLRCGLLANSAGMNIEGIASSTKWYFWPNGFAREVIAIFVMTKRIHIIAAVVIAIICEVLI